MKRTGQQTQHGLDYLCSRPRPRRHLGSLERRFFLSHNGEMIALFLGGVDHQHSPRQRDLDEVADDVASKSAHLLKYVAATREMRTINSFSLLTLNYLSERPPCTYEHTPIGNVSSSSLLPQWYMG